MTSQPETDVVELMSDGFKVSVADLWACLFGMLLLVVAAQLGLVERADAPPPGGTGEGNTEVVDIRLASDGKSVSVAFQGETFEVGEIPQALQESLAWSSNGGGPGLNLIVPGNLPPHQLIDVLAAIDRARSDVPGLATAKVVVSKGN